MSASIFPIGPADLPRVTALARKIWPEAYAGILPAERISIMVEDIYAQATLEADIAERGHSYWLATADGADLGYGSAYVADGRVWIKKLYLLSAARGLGLGKGLIAAAAAQFGPELPMALYVNDRNAAAIAFYRSQGFEIEKPEPVVMGGFDYVDYIMLRPGK